MNFQLDKAQEDFSFNVTEKDIKKRTSRPVSQNSVMEDISAKEYLSIFGACLVKKTKKKYTLIGHIVKLGH